MNKNTLYTSAEIVWIDDSFATNKYSQGYNFWEDMFNIPEKIYRLLDLKISMFCDYENAIKFIEGSQDTSSTYYYFIVDLNLPKNIETIEDTKPKFGKSIGMKLVERGFTFTFLSSASNLGDLKGEECILKTKGDYYIKQEHSDLRLPSALKNKLLSNIKKNIQWIDIQAKLKKETTKEFFHNTSEAFSQFPYYDKYKEFVDISEFNSLQLHKTIFIKSHYNNNEYFEKQSILIMLADSIINSFSEQNIYYYHIDRNTKDKLNEFNAWISKIRNNNNILVIKISNISIETFIDITNDLHNEKVIFILKSDEYEIYIESYNDSYSLYEIPSFENHDIVQKRILVANILQFLLHDKEEFHPIYKKNPQLLFDPVTYTALTDPSYNIKWVSDSYELFKEISELLATTDADFTQAQAVKVTDLLSIKEFEKESCYVKILKDSIYSWLKNSWNFPYGIEVNQLHNLNKQTSKQWELASVIILSSMLNRIDDTQLDNPHILEIKKIINDANIKHIIFDEELLFANKEIVSSFKWPHKEFPIPSIIHKKFEEINKHLWFQHNKFNYINYSKEISMQYSGLEEEIEYYDKIINLINNTYQEFPSSVHTMFKMVINDIQHRKKNVNDDTFVAEFKRFSNTLLRISLVFSAFIELNEDISISIDDDALTNDYKLGKIDNASFGKKVEVLRKTLQNSSYFTLQKISLKADIKKLQLLSKNSKIEFNIDTLFKDTKYDTKFNPIKEKNYQEYIEKELYPTKISQALEFSKQIFSLNLPIKIMKHSNSMILFNYLAYTRNKAIEHATIKINTEIFYEIIIFSYESLLLQLRFIDKTINKKVQYTNKTNYLDLICEPTKASIENIENFEQFKKALDSKVEIDSSIKEENA